jgi:hypothetical protein
MKFWRAAANSNLARIPMAARTIRRSCCREQRAHHRNCCTYLAHQIPPLPLVSVDLRRNVFNSHSVSLSSTFDGAIRRAVDTAKAPPTRAELTSAASGFISE